MVIGSSKTPSVPGSRVPLIDSIPTDDTTKSKEWTTSGKRINPDGSEITTSVIRQEFDLNTIM